MFCGYGNVPFPWLSSPSRHQVIHCKALHIWLSKHRHARQTQKAPIVHEEKGAKLATLALPIAQREKERSGKEQESAPCSARDCTGDLNKLLGERATEVTNSL